MSSNLDRRSDDFTNGQRDVTALTFALSNCAECGRPFPQPVSEERARADWGDAADDEIAYCCESCGEDFERGEDHYGR